MADTKISLLTELAEEPAATDNFPLEDKSAVETKRIKWSTIKALFLLSSAGTTTPTASSIPISAATKLIDPAWMEETIELVILDNTTALTVADGLGSFYFVVPARWNGWNITGAHAAVPGTVSSSGVITVQIYNLTDSCDILSTRITIDATEYTSYTADIPPVVDTAHDDLATADRIRFDCDGAGTGTKGLVVILSAAKP